MSRVILTPAARGEMTEAHAWYDAHGEGLGERFLAEADAAIERIVASPHRFPRVFQDVRRARLIRFPYGLFFRDHQDTIFILACFIPAAIPNSGTGASS